MISKKGVEDITLIIILAIGIVSFIFLYQMVTSGMNTACKSAQMDELGRVWQNLYVYNRSYDPSRPSGFNRLEPPFELKSTCVTELRYDEVKDVIYVKWRDSGQEEDMPGYGKWYNWNGDILDGTNNDKKLFPGTYEMIISYKNVTVMEPQSI